ncbi:hypothetical protein BOX15_Mlig026797g6, partial [Macrostomum lignano]
VFCWGQTMTSWIWWLLALLVVSTCPGSQAEDMHDHMQHNMHVPADPGVQHDGHSMHHDHSMEHESGSTSPLIVLIFNGLRYDLPDVYKSRGLNLSSFEMLLKQGVRASKMRSVNPTDSMPNYWSMLTGLYPESHCIPFDSFLDSDRPGVVFHKTNLTSLSDAAWFYKGFPEPLWLANQRQGGKSLLLLPGKALLFGGSSGSPQQIGTSSNPAAQVQLLIDLMAKPGTHGKISFVLMYFTEPGDTARAHGPVSKEVGEKLVELDGHLGRLLGGLRQLGMLDSVNLVVTTDHGMAAVDSSKVLELNSLLPADWFKNRLNLPPGAQAQLWPKAGHQPADLINRLAKSKTELSVWDVTHLPSELRLSGCRRRLPPVYARANPPWLLRLSAGAPLPLGVSGYSADTEDMRPLWVARGPDFKAAGAVVDLPLESVDFYPLACQLLGLQPKPNNGSLARISPLLTRYIGGEGFLATFAGVLLLFSFFGAILIVTAVITSRQPVKTVRGELGS